MEAIYPLVTTDPLEMVFKHIKVGFDLYGSPKIHGIVALISSIIEKKYFISLVVLVIVDFENVILKPTF